MATAPDFEGKRMVRSSDICGACETYIAVKICEECPVNLCATCAKGHQKLKYTADHILVDISKTDNKTKSSSTTSVAGKCLIHTKQQYTTLCKDCIQLVCDSCKADHGGHSLQPLNGDPKLCQKVCSKHIQKLLDELQELEEIKSVLESNIQTYNEATIVVDKWEMELTRMVKDKTDKLRKEIQKLKDEKHEQLTGRANGLMEKLKEIDDTITKLYSLRKSIDFNGLSTELATSQDLINKLESYKSAFEPIPQVVNVDDVFPNGNRKLDVQVSLDAMLDMSEINCFGKGPQPVAAWVFNATNNGKDISRYHENPVTMTNISYGLGPKGEVNGAAILPHTFNQSMIINNPTGKLRFSKTMTYYTNVYIEDTHQGALFEYQSALCFLVHPDSSSLQLQDMVKVPNVLNQNSWNKIVLVIDGQNVSLYVNGKLVNSGNYIYDTLRLTGTGNIHFGRRSITGGVYTLTGRIASARFYDVALTEREIQSLDKQGRTLFC